MVFSISLSDTLNRLYHTSMTKELLTCIGQLINRICNQQTGEQAKALKMSLVVPFLALGQASEEIILTLVTQNLFSDFEELDKSGAVTVFKSYLKL